MIRSQSRLDRDNIYGFDKTLWYSKKIWTWKIDGGTSVWAKHSRPLCYFGPRHACGPHQVEVCRLPDWTRKNKSTDPSIAAGCETLNMKATICRHLHLLTKPTKISKSGSKQSTSISFRNKLRRILGYLMDLHPSTCDTIL